MRRFTGLTIALLVFGITFSPVSAADPPTDQVNLNDVQLDQDNLRVHFIDVGNGLAMLIETPGDDVHIFVDGGDRGRNQLRRYVDKFVGDNPINIAIVTHADKDHYWGLHNEIIGPFDVEQFWYTGYESKKFDKPTSYWSKMLKKVDEEPDIDIFSPINDWVEAGPSNRLTTGGLPTTRPTTCGSSI